MAYKYSSLDFYDCIFLWIISEVLKKKNLFGFPLQCKRSKEQRDALLKRLWGIYIAGGCATMQNAHFSYFFLYKEGRVVKRIEESNWSNQPQQ